MSSSATFGKVMPPDDLGHDGEYNSFTYAGDLYGTWASDHSGDHGLTVTFKYGPMDVEQGFMAKTPGTGALLNGTSGNWWVEFNNIPGVNGEQVYVKIQFEGYDSGWQAVNLWALGNTNTGPDTMTWM